MKDQLGGKDWCPREHSALGQGREIKHCNHHFIEKAVATDKAKVKTRAIAAPTGKARTLSTGVDDLTLTFLDFSKAYDNVPQDDLWEYTYICIHLGETFL